MSKQRTRRQKAIIRRRIFLGVVSLTLVIIITLAAFLIYSIFGSDKDNETSEQNSSQTSSQKEEVKETFATVLSTGDIMVHGTQLDGAYVKETGEYDFSAFFKEASVYFNKSDVSVANLEVTFGGTESGKFSGYPAFNTPDSLADVIKNSGLNLLLTSNNHSYDTGLYGLKRTAQVLKERGIEFIGTRESEADAIYVVKEVNEIKIGMANFTYETTGTLADRKYLNGGVISQEANNLINTFSYNHIDDFYTEAQKTINDMKQKGAEFIVFYMHWGDEYKTTANTWQKTIAQKLCNLGVDIIIGSHPHVVQPVELIVSEDSQNTTVCLYSTGNAVSNQRQELMVSCPSGHTEDGLFFNYTLKKTGEEVVLNSIDIIPTWVNKYRGGSGYQYTIYPLENPETDVTKYGLDSTASAKALKSYERTKAIVAEGLTLCQNEIGCEITFPQ